MSLYLKHRPKTFSDLFGNEKMIESITNMVSDKTTCPHSFLLHGPTGCGKTTIARIIAQELDSSEDDTTEVDSADFRGIDTVRAIRQQSHYKPLNSSCRVWIIDECHKMTNDAQNALLKILEDTPKHVYFILCTTEPQKLITTIKRRCSQFQVHPLNDRQMMRLLRSVVKAEGKQLSKSVYEQIIADTAGYPGNALQVLDQVLHVEKDSQLEIAKQSIKEQTESIELCRVLIQGGSWKNVARILEGLKDQEPENIRRHVLGYAQAVVLKNDNPRAGLVLEEFIEPFYNSGFPGLVYACYSIIKSQ